MGYDGDILGCILEEQGIAKRLVAPGRYPRLRERMAMVRLRAQEADWCINQILKGTSQISQPDAKLRTTIVRIISTPSVKVKPYNKSL